MVNVISSSVQNIMALMPRVITNDTVTVHRDYIGNLPWVFLYGFVLFNMLLVIMRFLSGNGITVTHSRGTKFIPIFVCDCNAIQDLPTWEQKCEHGKQNQVKKQPQTQNYLFKIKGYQQVDRTHCCLIIGIFTQLAAATAAKGTQRATRGGAF